MIRNLLIIEFVILFSPVLFLWILGAGISIYALGTVLVTPNLLIIYGGIGLIICSFGGLALAGLYNLVQVVLSSEDVLLKKESVLQILIGVVLLVFLLFVDALYVGILFSTELRKILFFLNPIIGTVHFLVIVYIRNRVADNQEINQGQG